MSDAGFCTLCGVGVQSFDGLEACPNCGSTSVPCAVADQVNVAVNWHELRILCIWAENWAYHSEKESPGMSGTVYAIASRLAEQHPGRAPLTMSGEFAALKDAGVKFTTTHPAARGEST